MNFIGEIILEEFCCVFTLLYCYLET